MSKIRDAFKNGKALIPFITCGDPDLETTEKIVDAICMDVIVAGYQIQQRNAEMTILDESVASETYGVGFKKGNEELRDKVNDTLKEMAADGTLAEISTKWFTKDVTTIK